MRSLLRSPLLVGLLAPLEGKEGIQNGFLHSDSSVREEGDLKVTVQFSNSGMMGKGTLSFLEEERKGYMMSGLSSVDDAGLDDDRETPVLPVNVKVSFTEK